MKIVQFCTAHGRFNDEAAVISQIFKPVRSSEGNFVKYRHKSSTVLAKPKATAFMISES